MTRDKKIQNNLAQHFKLMKELIEQGLSKEDASKKAYDILFKKDVAK